MPKLKKPQILLRSVIKGLIEQKSHFYPRTAMNALLMIYLSLHKAGRWKCNFTDRDGKSNSGLEVHLFLMFGLKSEIGTVLRLNFQEEKLQRVQRIL